MLVTVTNIGSDGNNATL